MLLSVPCSSEIEPWAFFNFFFINLTLLCAHACHLRPVTVNKLEIKWQLASSRCETARALYLAFFGLLVLVANSRVPSSRWIKTRAGGLFRVTTAMMDRPTDMACFSVLEEWKVRQKNLIQRARKQHCFSTIKKILKITWYRHTSFTWMWAQFIQRTQRS